MKILYKEQRRKQLSKRKRGNYTRYKSISSIKEGVSNLTKEDIISTAVVVLILLVIYYFGTYTNKKREKELKKLQDNLKEGDKVITVSGISGVIDKIFEDRVIIKTYPDSVKISVEKWSIATLDDREI